MQYDPEHLKQLLSFIERIYNDKDCGEFAAALRGIVGAESSSSASRSDSKIDKIEQYLALDYEMDSVVNHDYDFISDRVVRDTLNADWREMMRIRYGLRGHRIDFEEYARFACLQVEMLLKYFYLKKYGDGTALLDAIKQNYRNDPNTTFKPEFMSLNLMVNNLKYEFGWDYRNKLLTLLDIVEVRNGESHRSPEEFKKSETALEKSVNQLKKKPSLSPDEEKELNKLKKDLKNLRNFYTWLSSAPYKEVVDNLEMLVNAIRSSLCY